MSDSDGSVTLVITDDKLKAMITIREVESLNESVLHDLLREKGIKYGVNQQLINELLSSPRRGTFLIAEGKPPREGRDGYVEYLFTSRAPAAHLQDEKNIDFREIFNVPSVNANTVLAVYHPMVKGEDGITVTGQVIPARKVVELSLKAGKGASLAPDGKAVSSAVNGRPWVKKQGRSVIVGVDAVYQHEGDVDIKSGNLRFHGDVFVTGNVTENMIVDVTGNLKVAGFVSRSTINVGGNLEVMKVITAGKVSAGGMIASFSDLEHRLREIDRVVRNLEAAAEQFQSKLKNNNHHVQYGQLIMALLDKKFIDFNKQVQDFCDLVKKQSQNLPEELQDVAAALNGITGIKVLSLKNLEGIKKSLENAINYFDLSDRQPSHVVVNSVWNSEVTATGNIKITGQGAFNSRLHACGAVDIKGVIRGGEIYARGNITVGEIGGPMGVRTLARTEEGSVIKAKIVYNGSVLQIGPRVFTANEDYSMVRARINEDGDIVLF
jgi:hypothetical protein